MKFTHLHVHSHYSLLDGLIKIDQLLDYCQELGMDSIALTDHGNMYGAVEFFKKAKKRGIKPIIGSEVYLAPNGMKLKRPKIDDKKHHLVLLAKNKQGYKNLIKLTTKAHLEGFYYRPRIDKELLKQHGQGLIALSSCMEGSVPQAILNGNLEKAEEEALEYQEIFGPGNFYLEIQHHPGIKKQETVNEKIIEIAKKHNIPLVATNDVHYLKSEDAQAQDILVCIQTNCKLEEEERFSMKGYDLSLKSPQQMAGAFKDVPQAIGNTQKIVNDCNLELELGKIQLPHFKVPAGYSPDSYLKELAYQGLKKHYSNPSKEIKERLEYELSMIERTGYASYFLIVQDFVNWAKNQGIVVGPGRGSAAGSLVSYLLNITEVDPLKYDLLFERFLNPERAGGMPDIDLDFADARRDEVIDYVAQKYGHDHVAQIITFGTMAARQAVRDAGRALGLSYSFCDQIAKMIPMFSSLDDALERVPDLKSIYQTDSDAKKLIDSAQKLEGVARHASTHACGVVITKENIDEYVPRQHPPQDDKNVVTQYEMHSIEDLGLLKIDLLGLKNLTILERAIKTASKTKGVNINLDKIPLDDKKTLQLLQQIKTTGVFQLECLSGETIVSNTTIKNLYEKKNKKVLNSIYLDKGKVHKNKIINILKRGKKDVYVLVSENNWYIKATKDHYFLTENGWKKLKDIKLGERVLLKTKAKHLVYNTCSVCGKQISGQKDGKSNFCYKCSATFYRNPSKKESRKKIKEARIRFYQEGSRPWNYGLTTENNEIWKNTALKISKALTGKSLEERVDREKANEIKRILSERFEGTGNPMFGKRSPHRKGGFRQDLGHYVRSNWEADFARILRLYNLEYQYEPKTFSLTRPNGKVLNYTPDFYVKANNTFYEIKGWFHELDKEKIELFKKQYPQHNLILVNTTKFAELALRYKNLIKWECPRIPIKNSFQFKKVKQIKYSGQEETYDIVMEAPGNNFIASGFVVHNSSGMKRYLKRLKPTQFEDIIAMVALYRPGPMEWIPDFISRKHGDKKIEYIHPALKPILEKTYGIAVYQEQVLQIAREIAGFTMGEADILRKAMGKKIRSLLEEQRDKFIKGAQNKDISQDIAKKIFNFIEPFAGYGFNRAHATCYALIGYWTAYLKSHWPAEFMASLLTSDKNNIDRISIEVDESRRLGIDVLPPDINESLADFTVTTAEDGKEAIRFGLGAIKNVGHNVIKTIIEERKKNGPFKTIDDFIERVESKDLNKKSLESLIKCGALDDLGERNRLLANTEEILIHARDTQKAKIHGQSSLFSSTTLKSAPRLKFKDSPPSSKKEKMRWEKELLGLYVSEHPIEEYQAYLKGHTVACKDLSSEMVGRQVKIGGIINKIQKVFTRKSQKPMIFVQIEDLTSKIEVLVFPHILEKNPSVWREDKIVLISGKLSDKDGSLKLLCDRASEIPSRYAHLPAT